MSRLFAIASLLVLLLPSLIKLGVVIHFQFNRSYIVDTHCIRRNEPVPMCSGKCYLGAQLRQVDEQAEGTASLPLRHKVETVCFLPQNFAYLSLVLPIVEGRTHFAEVASKYTFTLFYRLLRPPIISFV